MDVDETSDLLTIVALTWPNFKVEAATLPALATVWSAYLRDITFAEAQAAVFAFGERAHPFAPAPGQVRALVIEQLGFAPPLWSESFDQAAAWARDKAYNQGRRDREIHPVAKRTVESIGVMEFLRGDDGFVERTYRDNYAKFAEQYQPDIQACRARKAVLAERSRQEIENPYDPYQDPKAMAELGLVRVDGILVDADPEVRERARLRSEQQAALSSPKRSSIPGLMSADAMQA